MWDAEKLTFVKKQRHENTPMHCTMHIVLKVHTHTHTNT